MKLIVAMLLVLCSASAAGQPSLYAGSTKQDASITELQRWFDRLDADGDGMLSRRETSDDPRFNDDLWRRLDLTKDDRLNRAEFLSGMELRDIDTFGSGGPTGENLRGPQGASGANEAPRSR